MKIINKNILSFALFILIIPFVMATGVIQTDTFYDASNNALSNVQDVIYYCSGAYTGTNGDMRCTSVGSVFRSLNSGSSNSISFEYPYNPLSTQSNPDYYAQYLYKECYLPKDYIDYVWGSDAYLNYNYNFQKASSCHSPIDSFSITNTNYANEPVVANVQVSAEADAHSAFTDLNNGEVWYPPEYASYYSAETRVTFSVFDGSNNLVHTESKTVDIYMDSKQNVQFSWTPLNQGDYTARITTKVTDCQCSSNFEQSSQKVFTVWAERPKNECYTIINDLTATPQFPTAGSPITITFNKISNYADNSFVKTAVSTSVTYRIIKNGVVVYTQNVLVPANVNTNDYKTVSHSWTPTSGGEYSINVTGIAQSSFCTGKTNPSDTAILGIFVSSPTQYNVAFNVKNNLGNNLNSVSVSFGSQTGQTDAYGNVAFKVNPGTYSWQASKTGYITQTGSLLVNSNKSVSLVLQPSSVPVTQYNVAFNVKNNLGNNLNGVSVVFGSQTGQTDAYGNVAFNVNSGTYSWQASKTGYITQTGSLLVNSDKSVSLVLQPSTPTQYNVDVNVKNSSGSNLEGVSVSFGSQTGQTNAYGNITFAVDYGVYSWQASKTGYITQTGSLFINGDKDVFITLLTNVSSNFAPVLNIPDQFLNENSGNNENIINLMDFTTDANTPLAEINYSIISESDISIVDCNIDANKNLDCIVIPNEAGYSEINVSASDGSNITYDAFNVYVGNFTNGTMIHLIYPNGGEKVSGNVGISWVAVNSNGHSLLIDIYYSMDNGINWTLLSANETNDGSYIWNTKNYPNDKYLLRVFAKDYLSGTFIYDQTDEEFSVFNSKSKRTGSNKDSTTICEPLIQCSGWSECYNGIQTRTCKDANNCGEYFEKTLETKVCGESESIILNLKSEEEGFLWKNIFLWILIALILLICAWIIFALLLVRKKE